MHNINKWNAYNTTGLWARHTFNIYYNYREYLDTNSETHSMELDMSNMKDQHYLS